jgi:hypothetical protein
MGGTAAINHPSPESRLSAPPNLAAIQTDPLIKFQPYLIISFQPPASP